MAAIQALLDRAGSRIRGGLVVAPEAINIPTSYVHQNVIIDFDERLARRGADIQAGLVQAAATWEVSIVAGLYRPINDGRQMANEALLIGSTGVRTIHTKGNRTWGKARIGMECLTAPICSDLDMPGRSPLAHDITIICCLMAGTEINPWSRQDSADGSVGISASPWLADRWVASANKQGASFISDPNRQVFLVPSICASDTLIIARETGRSGVSTVSIGLA